MAWSSKGTSARVSVCIPAYRAEAYIGETIESVLAQTYEDFELVILVNNSPDGTGEIARSYDDPRISVETNTKTLPLAENWNAAARLAQGEYLKILCADDTLHPDCLAEQAAILDENPDVVLTASRRNYLGADGDVVLRDRGLNRLVGKLDSASVIDEVVRSGMNPLGFPATMLLRRDDFCKIDGFDTRWLYPLDLEMALRLLARGQFYGTGRSLASFRVSPSSASSTGSNQGTQHRELLRVVAEDPQWEVGSASLRRGIVFSHIEAVKKFLFFAAINSRWRMLRQVPSLVLRRQSP